MENVHEQTAPNHGWGLTIYEALALILVLGSLFGWFLFSERGHATRGKVSRAKADMRTLSVALEAYFLAENAYPAWAIISEGNANSGLEPAAWGKLKRQPSFRAPGEAGLATLTTPRRYLVKLPPDRFAPAGVATFSYYSINDHEAKVFGWAVWSPGPDLVYDLTIDNVAKFSYPMNRQSVDSMRVKYHYDVTNGSKSAGDIFTVKTE